MPFRRRLQISSLASLGIEGVASVRQGKLFEVELADGQVDPEARLREACERLLANTVVENYRIELDNADAAASGQDAAERAEMPAEGHP